MSSLGRHPDWDSIIIRTFPISSSHMSKTGKNSQNPSYPLKLKNPLYLKSQKSIFNRLGVFRSVRDLEVVSREGLAPIVKAYSRLILVDGLVL